MKRIMGERLTHVRELVAGKRDLLDRAAAMLLEKETIEGEDFATLVGTVSAEEPLAPEPTPAQAVA
jgi:ATP-dependent Zn protease